MRVKRLNINSFRGIGEMTLELSETEPTVFIGVNGVGKSSILDCLAILLSKFIARIQFDPQSTARWRKWQGLDSHREWEQNLANGRYFNEQDIKNRCNKIYTKIAIIIGESLNLEWSVTKNRKETSEPPRDELEELSQVTNNLRELWKTNSEANLPLVVYYPVNRSVLDIPLELPKEDIFQQIKAYENAIDGIKVNFNNFFEWFRTVEDVENEELRENSDYRDKRLEAVRTAIYSLLGEEFSNLRVRRSPLRMTITKQGEELIVNQLSDGEKCLLAMVGDLARRLAIANPGLSDPLEGSGVVLIDEIELHLHPKWQREIIPALTRTFPNCQFIVTTHSPQVISEVKPEGIYILEKRNGDIIATHPESSYGRDSNRILEDLMDTPERPQEIKENLLELFRLIARGDLDSARQLHQKIADEIGSDEPELVGASVSMRRREILGR